MPYDTIIGRMLKKRYSRQTLFRILVFLIIVNICSIFPPIPNTFILAFISYTIIFIILISKTISRMKRGYREKNFIKIGKKLVIISLFLMLILLVNMYSFARQEPEQHFVFVYFLFYIILFCAIIIGAALIFIGIFFIEKNKISFLKKILYLLLVIFVILILFLLFNLVLPSTDLLQTLLKDIAVKTKNTDLCSKIPFGSPFWGGEDSYAKYFCYIDVRTERERV